MINSIAGGGTLATFPSLVALGLDPKLANTTSTVALWPASLAATWGYRDFMEGTRIYLFRLGIPCLAGGAAGALLLLLTPGPLFTKVVPWLILFATALFMAQEAVTRLLPTAPQWRSVEVEGLHCTPRQRWWIVAVGSQFLVGVYAGYFGAGASILTLVTLGLLGIADIHRANGIKNYLGLCMNGVATAAFIICNVVSWPHVGAMAMGGMAGAFLSARAARHLGHGFVRGTVIVTGLVIGSVMLWKIGF